LQACARNFQHAIIQVSRQQLLNHRTPDEHAAAVDAAFNLAARLPYPSFVCLGKAQRAAQQSLQLN
jgi:hypothetical protein